MLSARSRSSQRSSLGGQAAEAWNQVRLARKYPLYLPVPPSLLAGLPTEDDEVQEQLGRYSFLVEFFHIVSLVPLGIYVLPDWDATHVWHCCIFIREGLWRGLAAPFRLVFPREAYPREAPAVFFEAPVPPHVAIEPSTGALQLPAEFINDWTPDRFCSVHVLLYIKQIFYDHKCIVGTEKSANPEFRATLLRSKSEALRLIDRATRISVTYNARLIGRKSNVCPSLIRPDANNSEVPLAPQGLSDAELLQAAIEEADRQFVVRSDGSASFQHLGSIVKPTGKGSSGAPSSAPAPPNDEQNFDEERMKMLLNAIETFSNPAGRMSDPIEGFLDWFAEDYLPATIAPLGSFNSSVGSFVRSSDGSPKLLASSSSSRRRASHV